MLVRAAQVLASLDVIGCLLAVTWPGGTRCVPLGWFWSATGLGTDIQSALHVRLRNVPHTPA
jgi:hypothetical protein